MDTQQNPPTPCTILEGAPADPSAPTPAPPTSARGVGLGVLYLSPAFLSPNLSSDVPSSSLKELLGWVFVSTLIYELPGLDWTWHLRAMGDEIH
ncbi:hypothetical protein AAFF_G00309910 [Aldrovandia affinis]|uniref:Uncharacterized protein n=1 Tax=Aldrovandia affinis TaxID=143900 RepID=A0AAD7SPA5_9TELE|nr:hypothetical protein AAFF_G00309910 [Aldrovandia affinis]